MFGSIKSRRSEEGYILSLHLFSYDSLPLNLTEILTKKCDEIFGNGRAHNKLQPLDILLNKSFSQKFDLNRKNV